LLGLKRDRSDQPGAPHVEVKTPDGRSIVLTDATPELLTSALSVTQSSWLRCSRGRVR
jgi:hypothetical protein